ncbi:hypothetical protein ACWC10_27385, partial [Streptomyces sp. NPDC001595]
APEAAAEPAAWVNYVCPVPAARDVPASAKGRASPSRRTARSTARPAARSPWCWPRATSAWSPSRTCRTG